jgi:subtilase family serine protease
VSWSGPTKRGVYTVSGTFTTINSGSANANNVVVKLYFVNGSNETSIKSYKYRTIAAGSSQAATIRFNTTSYPLGNQLLADIDPSKEIIESDESNNKVYYTIH